MGSYWQFDISTIWSYSIDIKQWARVSHWWQQWRWSSK